MPRLEPLGTNRAVTNGLLRAVLLLAEGRSKRATIGLCIHALFHGPKVITQPGGRGKGSHKGEGLGRGELRLGAASFELLWRAPYPPTCNDVVANPICLRGKLQPG